MTLQEEMRQRADDCERAFGYDDGVRLLREAAAQLDALTAERDELRQRTFSAEQQATAASNRRDTCAQDAVSERECRLANEAELLRADATIGDLRAQLATALQQCANVAREYRFQEELYAEAERAAAGDACLALWRRALGVFRAALATPSAQERRPGELCTNCVGRGWVEVKNVVMTCGVCHGADIPPVAQESSGATGSPFEPWEVERLHGAIAFMREAWRSNDGAEGESVKLVCAALEKCLATDAPATCVYCGKPAQGDPAVCGACAAYYEQPASDAAARPEPDGSGSARCQRIGCRFFGTGFEHVRCEASPERGPGGEAERWTLYRVAVGVGPLYLGRRRWEESKRAQWILGQENALTFPTKAEAIMFAREYLPELEEEVAVWPTALHNATNDLELK